MNVRQQNIKSFDIEIEDEVEFFSYFNKNLPLLQSHLMILRGNVSDGVKVYLQNKKVAFVDANEVNISTKRAKKVEPQESVKRVEVPAQESVVEPRANIQIFGIVEGEVQAGGEFILLQGIGNSGHVMLHDEKVESQKCAKNEMTLVKLGSAGLTYKSV